MEKERCGALRLSKLFDDLRDFAPVSVLWVEKNKAGIVFSIHEPLLNREAERPLYEKERLNLRLLEVEQIAVRVLKV